MNQRQGCWTCDNHPGLAIVNSHFFWLDPSEYIMIMLFMTTDWWTSVVLYFWPNDTLCISHEMRNDCLYARLLVRKNAAEADHPKLPQNSYYRSNSNNMNGQIFKVYFNRPDMCEGFFPAQTIRFFVPWLFLVAAWRRGQPLYVRPCSRRSGWNSKRNVPMIVGLCWPI